ncbi:serine/threonine-protein kinase [Mastigocoleus testarum]|uniref:non-specific serine/threonine protein kinase n=1 Tax=Mastigocoleus testarum BC008 TaxID=371196 RepID=A0A0V8A0K9_9CYAN|nr:serine/threonine-protein kinase [Mastigocoleus testarum]KST70316.1 hypothetical protein BC008_44750 [Mastigocoleus testarum BC008]
MLNKILASRYKIIKFLGAGGFGQTYIAEDTHRPGNPICVVKHLKPINSQTYYLETSKRFFQKEAEALEKLGNYPQIPRLLAYFEEENEFYLIQEFIDGNLLNSEFKPGCCWSENQVMQMLQEILEILHFVHSNGVIHRDLKPGNIIRRQEDNKLVLIDFGIIKEISMQLTAAKTQMATSVIIGTAGYMPPEQARGKPRFSSDIYALGVIAIQAITGFQELKEDANGEIEWQSHTQVNPQLAVILSNMVRYQFQDRYKSAQEVLDVIKSLTNPTVASPRYPVSQPNTISSSSASASKSIAAPHNTASSDTPLSNAISSSRENQNSGNTVSNSAPINSASINSASPTASNFDAPHSVPQSSPKNPLKVLVFPVAVITLLIVAAGGIITIFGLNWGKNQNFLANVEEIKSFKKQKEYSKCIDKGDKVSLLSQDSLPYSQAKTELINIVNECRILQAKLLAERGDFAKAITEANKVPKNQAFSENSQQSINVWSKKIIDKATENYENSGDVDNAITTLKVIPSTSSHYKNVQELTQQWQKQNNTNKEYLSLAQRALTQNRYNDAIAAANKISNTPYWDIKKKGIIQKVTSLRKNSTTDPKTIDNCQGSQSIFAQGSNCNN